LFAVSGSVVVAVLKIAAPGQCKKQCVVAVATRIVGVVEVVALYGYTNPAGAVVGDKVSVLIDEREFGVRRAKVAIARSIHVSVEAGCAGRRRPSDVGFPVSAWSAWF
jgi:hypothetical protein